MGSRYSGYQCAAITIENWSSGSCMSEGIGAQVIIREGVVNVVLRGICAWRTGECVGSPTQHDVIVK